MIAADVVITFGRMPRALWPECTGKSYPMCQACWQHTRDVAVRVLPDIESRIAELAS